MRFASAKRLPQSTGYSDHCPLISINDRPHKAGRRFRFESYWQDVSGFNEVVAQAWGLNSTGDRSPLAALDLNLREAKKALQTWSRLQVRDLQKQLFIADELILQLDTAQDHRVLTTEESALRRSIKSRNLGLAVLIKIKRKQRSQIT
jgi:hypothetical protein